MLAHLMRINRWNNVRLNWNIYDFGVIHYISNVLHNFCRCYWFIIVTGVVEVVVCDYSNNWRKSQMKNKCII